MLFSVFLVSIHFRLCVGVLVTIQFFLYKVLVLAVSARLLSYQPNAFDDFLTQFPNAQILAWTGTGEPPIPRRQVERIRSQFQASSNEDRIGFDCAILEKKLND
jgi:hypothetical protein